MPPPARSDRSRTDPTRGYTLVEVIIAIALSVGLVGTLLWFYQHAAEVRTQAVDEVERISARRMVMEQVTDRLRSTIALPVANLGLRGDAQSVTLLTATFPGRAAWAVRTATEDPIPPEQDYMIVTLGPAEVEDDTGATEIIGIRMQTQKVLAAPEAEQGKEIQSVLLTGRYRFIRLRYWDSETADWVEQWEQQTLPPAVELSLGRAPLEEGVEPIDYPYETYTRVVHLPGQGQGMSMPDLGSLLEGVEIPESSTPNGGQNE